MAAHHMLRPVTCVFCDDPNGAGEILLDDGRAMVVLHDDWAVLGHAMVIWKTHVENVSDLTFDEYAHFAALHHRAERALLAVTGADRAILLKLGIATPHLHLHIYPVSSALDRAAVMAIIDGRVRDELRGRERATFIEELRQRLT
jgi:diadenosine tetraphosphate (Ap4A) HIT family hydrolase